MKQIMVPVKDQTALYVQRDLELSLSSRLLLSPSAVKGYKSADSIFND